MSGHSKWAQIKRQKGVNDARRGQLFTKLGREISVAAREGGPDPDGNFRLRLAIQKARQNNMPMENIERAIKRGAGSGEGSENWEQVFYEGYGPGGVAILVQALTDNRNRTTSEVRSIFTRSGGSLGEAGSVAWIFDQRGQVIIDLANRDPDETQLEVIDAGAEDVIQEGNELIVYTQLEDLNRVRQELEKSGHTITGAELTMLPKTQIELDEHQAEQVLRLIDRLEELDDVQQVYSNYAISDELLERMAG
ncbi:MAG: YebC/PmpR family DNA-binding transcriptional regulator [Chloroflexi bacterium]|nr:YebC/PmpR family DNA-binding transcriptional regulator [Chloroflexota bacterium]